MQITEYWRQSTDSAITERDPAATCTLDEQTHAKNGESRLCWYKVCF